MQVAGGFAPKLDHLREADDREVFGLFQKLCRITQEILGLDLDRKPFDPLCRILGKLNRKFLQHFTDKWYLSLNAPMCDAICVGVDLHHAGHHLGKIRDIREEFAHLLDA